MVGHHTRRAVLKRSLAGPAIVAGIPPHATRARAQDGPSSAGELVDVHGTPVEGACVELFAVADQSPIDETTTDADGQFTLSTGGLGEEDDALLLARKPVETEVAGEIIRNDWFTAHGYRAGGRRDLPGGDTLGRIALDKELLVFPTELYEWDTSDDTPLPMAVVTVWRHVGNPYNSTDPNNPGLHAPTDQIISIEVTNVAFHVDMEREPHEIHRQIPTGGNYDLTHGLFALTFPEDAVRVDYGGQDDIELANGTVVESAETESAIETFEGTPPTAAWHPLRTDLPAYAVSRKLRDNRYAPLSSADAEAGNRTEEALETAIGTIPVLGEFMEIVDLLSDGAVDNTAELTFPMPPEARNENTHDSVVLAWQSDNSVIGLSEASVVFRVPLRFQYEEERTTQFVAQATWHHASLAEAVAAGRGTLQTLHARGPSGHIDQRPAPPDQPPQPSADGTAPGEWTLYQVDARNTGHHPAVTGPTETVTDRWTFDTGDKVWDAPAVADGTVYVGSDDNALYAIDAATGEVREEGDWPVAMQPETGPAVIDGTVYVGTVDNYLYALDAVTGAQQWAFEASDAVFTPPTVADGTVYIGSWDGKVYALDAASGDLRDGSWPVEIERYIVDSSPAVADDTVYIGDNSQGEEPIGGAVYALDAASGDLQDGHWPVETDGEVYSSPAVADGIVYVGSLDGNLYALDATSGAEQWTAEIGPVYGSPAVTDGTVYAGSLDGNVYALDAASGDPRDGNWPVESGGRVWAAPAVADGTVYFASADNNVYAVDAASGDEHWVFETGDIVRTSPAVVDGTVYVGSFDGTIYALAEGADDGDDGSAAAGSITEEGFEDGTVDGWALREDANDALSAEQSNQMGGSWLALLETNPPDSGEGRRPTAYRDFDGTLAAGTTLQASVSFTQRQPGHVPQIQYLDSSDTQNRFRLRFDPPVDNVWCQVEREGTTNRANFASLSAPNTVYTVQFTLHPDSIGCELFDSDGTSQGSTTVAHPDGFTYNTIDRVAVVSREPVDVRFDDISVARSE